jgi:serine/threonine-protein kinase
VGGPGSDRISVPNIQIANIPTAVPVSVVSAVQPAHPSDGTAETMHVQAGAVVARIPTATPAPAPDFRSRALAIYRTEIEPRLRPLLARADVLLGQAEARSKVPKRVILALVLAGAAIFLFVLPISLIARHATQSTSADGGLDQDAGAAASPEEIRAAALKGTTALEDLAVKYPKDPAVARELAFAYDAAGRGSDALRILRLMAEADPKSIAPDLMHVVSHAASKPDTSDAAFGLLEGPLGTDGVDALIELADSRDVPPATSTHAQRSLAKPAVRAAATPAAAFLIDIRVASTCEERHDVLVKSGSQADARASAVLHFLDTKHDCGRRRRDDCNPCLHKDDALAKAIEAASNGH